MNSTAIDHGHGVKKSTGFSIASLIGKESEKNESNTHRRSLESCVRSSSPVNKPDNNKNASRDKKDISQNIHQDLRKDVTYNSLHDSRRHHSDFSPVRRDRDSFAELHSASESLKHLHDVLSQTSGATGTYFSPRLCRHPLSALNLHSVYHSQLPPSTPLHPLVINSARDIRHLNPWISDRYPGYYYPRYPATPGFLFQPYRKPKRIRTAFSPSQLLQLEKAFEKSHYVVGQERKDLASELQLTETQVKVWFQNRRTKHKRMKAEDGEGPSSPENSMSNIDPKEVESDISDIDDMSDTDQEMMSHHQLQS